MADILLKWSVMGNNIRRPSKIAAALFAAALIGGTAGCGGSTDSATTATAGGETSVGNAASAAAAGDAAPDPAGGEETSAGDAAPEPAAVYDPADFDPAGAKAIIDSGWPASDVEYKVKVVCTGAVNPARSLQTFSDESNYSDEERVAFGEAFKYHCPDVFDEIAELNGGYWPGDGPSS